MPQMLRMDSKLTGKDGISVSTGQVYTFPLHSHAYYEMLLYRPFKGHITVNDIELIPSVPLAVLMTPNDLHGITLSGAAAEYIKIAFSRDALGGYLAGRLTAGVFFFIPEGQNAAIGLFEQLTREHPHEERAILLRALVLLMLDGGQALPSLPGAGPDSLISTAVTVIGDEFQSDLTLAALAKRLNVSYQHLSACFSKHLGLSFSAYLRELRLRHAKALLERDDRSVTEVCYDCGYRNLSHFLRSFKKRFGVTPKEYRQKNH